MDWQSSSDLRLVDAVFAALSDATRRELLERLSAGEAVTPSRLAADLPITRQAVSRHLGILEEAGLAASTVAGRERRYALRPDGLAPVEAWVARAEARWTHRLTALKSFVEHPPDQPPT